MQDIRVYVAWGNGITLNALPGVLVADIPGQADQTMLGDRIGSTGTPAVKSADRGDINDPPGAF